MSTRPYVSPYLYLIYSSTTESSEELNMIESFPIVQKPIYSLTETEMSEESSESFPIRSEHQIAQKPIYSSTTEFHLERRMSEETSRGIKSLPQRAEKPKIREMGQMSGNVGRPKLSLLNITLLFFYYSFYRI